MGSHVVEGVFSVEHPLLKVRLTTLRDVHTDTPLFRRTLAEVATLLAYEATRQLEICPKVIRTPLADYQGARIARMVVIVPILRAGLGMAEALLRVLPEARIGHVGLARDEKTLLPAHYYFKAPGGLEEAQIFLVDPMLATGNSAVEAASELKSRGARQLCLLCVLGCPEGASRFRRAHPDVPVFLAAMDPGLNEHAYIVPGLGDAGDRYFGT